MTQTYTMQQEPTQQELDFIAATNAHLGVLSQMEGDPPGFAELNGYKQVLSTSAALSKALDNLVEAYRQAGMLPDPSQPVHDGPAYPDTSESGVPQWFATRRNGQTFLVETISNSADVLLRSIWHEATDEAFAALTVQAKSQAGLLPVMGVPHQLSPTG